MNSQTVIRSIEMFCEELEGVAGFYTSLNNFVNRPVSKQNVIDFLKHGPSAVFVNPSDVTRTLSKLTIGQSQFNCDETRWLFLSPTSTRQRELKATLSAKITDNLISVLRLIKARADEVIGIEGETATEQLKEIKRCALMLPVIFKPERDLVVSVEQLMELSIEEDKMVLGIDDILLSVKEVLSDKLQYVYFNDIESGSSIGLNSKNWQSVKSVIARLNDVKII